LLAIMLQKKSKEDLGFNPYIISAVGFGTPPCVSREVAENCASFYRCAPGLLDILLLEPNPVSGISRFPSRHL
jgi:hypothetical protein